MKNKKNQTDSQQKNFEELFESLNDLKLNKKKRPWNKNKAESMAVSRAFLSIPRLKKYGETVAGCACWLHMMECSNAEHGMTLKQAYFCKNRLCVMCQWRRSLVLRKQLVELVKGHREEFATDVPVLATFTVVNEKGERLHLTIDQMNRAWTRLMQRKSVKGVVHSWFRSMEITYNEERDDYHPHFHALFMVPKSYFYKKRGMYIPRDEWLKLWQEAMRDDRITQVDIRVLGCKTDAELEASVGEVAKYMTKPNSYIFENEFGIKEANPKVVEQLFDATKGRRMIGFGGHFNKIRKAKKMIDVENIDALDLDGEEQCLCKICQQKMIDRMFSWYNEANGYYSKRSQKETDECGECCREEVDEEDEMPYGPTVLMIMNKNRSKPEKKPSMLLEALKKSMSRKQEPEAENDNHDPPVSEIERIQCRGPT